MAKWRTCVFTELDLAPYFVQLLTSELCFWLILCYSQSNEEHLYASQSTTTLKLYTSINTENQSPGGVLKKKSALKNFSKFTGKYLSWSLLLIKAWRPAIILTRDSSISAFLWFWEIFKNTYFVEDLWTAVLNAFRSTNEDSLLTS